MERIQTRDNVSCQVDRNRQIADVLDPHGFFTFEHIRNGKILERWIEPNVVTIEGKNFMLNTTFRNTANLTPWYMGLIDAVTGWTSVSENNTYDNIDQAGNLWDEFQAYTYAASTVNRGGWTIANPASAKQLTSSAQTQFDIVAPGGTIKGAFLCAGASAITKGDHTAGVLHKLFSVSVLTGGDVVVALADTFKVTYTITT